jgi:hypothetical protein
MMAGLELKSNFLPPMDNSRTRADAAARFFPGNSAMSSSFNIVWYSVMTIQPACSLFRHKKAITRYGSVARVDWFFASLTRRT